MLESVPGSSIVRREQFPTTIATPTGTCAFWQPPCRTLRRNVSREVSESIGAGKDQNDQSIVFRRTPILNEILFVSSQIDVKMHHSAKDSSYGDRRCARFV